MMKKLFPLLFASVLLLASCSKYEEGPKLSLLSKKARLTGTWQYGTLLKNGTDITASVNRSFTHLKLEKNGTASFINEHNAEMNLTGNWEFDHDKQNLVLKMNMPTDAINTETYQIIKLKKDELWLRIVLDNHTYEDHLKQ